MGQVVKFHVDGFREEVVTGWVALPSSTSETRVPAAALLLNTYEVGCALGGTYEGVITLLNLDAGRLEVTLLPWLLKSMKQRREGQFDSTAMQVRNGQIISSTVVSMGNARDIVVVALKQHALGHLAVLPARRCFNDIIGTNAWALGQVNRVTIRRYVSFSLENLQSSGFCWYFSLLNVCFSVKFPLNPNAIGHSLPRFQSMTLIYRRYPRKLTPRTNRFLSPLWKLPSPRALVCPKSSSSDSKDALMHFSVFPTHVDVGLLGLV